MPFYFPSSAFFFFFLFHLRHIISFVRWLPWATPLSKALCGYVICLTILEIHVGVPIAIRTLIKASHTVLLLRRQRMKRVYFSLMEPPESDSVSQDREQSCLRSLHLPHNHTHTHNHALSVWLSICLSVNCQCLQVMQNV